MTELLDRGDIFAEELRKSVSEDLLKAAKKLQRKAWQMYEVVVIPDSVAEVERTGRILVGYVIKTGWRGSARLLRELEATRGLGLLV